MNIVKLIRHWFCRDVVWRYPDLAALDSDDSHVYPMTCKGCGYVRNVTAGEIQDALADEALTIAASECFRRGTMVCGRVEGGKVIVDEDDGTETVIGDVS